MIGAFVALDPLPLLRLLGADARADVLHHRHLGRAALASTRRSSFLLYTLTASLLMLLAILYLVSAPRGPGRPSPSTSAMLYDVTLTPVEQGWLFAAFALAFAVKVPMFPLHTWLPDAHVEAPTGGSVILAGVMLKLGTYGFLRFAMPLFPNAMARRRRSCSASRSSASSTARWSRWCSRT
jgi:NADH-quinone oxidoreductase subunit M